MSRLRPGKYWLETVALRLQKEQGERKAKKLHKFQSAKKQKKYPKSRSTFESSYDGQKLENIWNHFSRILGIGKIWNEQIN